MEHSAIHKKASPHRLNIRHRRKMTGDAPKPTNASCVTNGSKILLPLNQIAFIRRLRDVLEGFVADKGGWNNISTAEAALIRRASTLIVECERRESLFAQADHADDNALCVYGTTVNTLRRILETLGLKRTARDITRPLADIIAELDKPEPAGDVP